MSKHREYRCCMCPNIYSRPESRVCPTGEQCGFVAEFRDERGWGYRVQPGLGDNNYKARYNKQPDKETGWKCMARLPWRTSFDEAQQDLNALAKDRGWTSLRR